MQVDGAWLSFLSLLFSHHRLRENLQSHYGHCGLRRYPRPNQHGFLVLRWAGARLSRPIIYIYHKDPQLYRVFPGEQVVDIWEMDAVCLWNHMQIQLLP